MEWTTLQFPAGGYGGGVGGRLNPTNGAHYAAWIFPAGGGGTNLLKLIKFSSWTAWSYGGTNYWPMEVASLPPVGTGWHPLKLVLSGGSIEVYYDGTRVISTTDIEANPYTSGGITLDAWTESTPYFMSISNLVVAP